MTYETSHLLMGVCVRGGGGVLSGGGGGVKKKYCCVRGRGHYMKNKNIGGMCFVNST